MEASPTTFLVLQSNTRGHISEKTKEPKKTKPKPVRLAELVKLLDTVDDMPPLKKNVRKQLWTTEKNTTNSKRWGSVMKANNDNVTKTVYDRSTHLNSKKPNIVNQTPLSDLKKIEANSKKPQKNFLPPNTFTKSITKPVIIPEIVIRMVPDDSSNGDNYNKINKPQDEILEKILTLVKKFDDRLVKTDNRIENLETHFNALTSREYSCCRCEGTKNKITNNKTEELNSDKISTNVNSETSFLQPNAKILIETYDNNNLLEVEKNPIIEAKIEDRVKKDMIVTIDTGLISLQKPVSKINFSEIKDTELPDTNILESNSTVVFPNTDETNAEIILNDNLDDKKNTVIKSKEENKNLSASKFELLEKQLKNNLNISPSISIPKSPNIETFIARNLTEEVASETSVNSEGMFRNLSALTYNDMRDHAKFLCTPVVKKSVTTQQPSSNRKIISLKIEKQLLMLNEEDV